MTLVSGSHVLIGIVPQGGALFLQAKLSASPPAANPARVDSVAIALAAQLAEIRRSDDRLFTLVLWTLGITATIALGLAVFSWWTSHKVYERDIDAIKKENRAIAEQAARELTASLQSATRSVQDSMKRELGEQFSSQLLRFNSEFVSLASVKVGRLRLQIGDYSGAIREA
jgi:uncharacterized protein YukE